MNESKYNAHWKTKILSDLGSFQRGKSRHRPRNDKSLFENGHFPLVQTGEIKDANLYITSHNATYNSFGLKQSKLWPKNTLCITIAANIAETALLGYPMCFPDSVVGFIANPKESSELFMHYVFTYIRKAIQSSASGSIQDNINIDYLTRLKFKIPAKSYQDGIVKTLSQIDSKIEINNQINAELEAMAKLLFDYWFVQFDFPFDFNQGKPDANGRPYKSSGGKMVYNKQLKREIPEGWDDGTLSDIANIIMGQSPPGNTYNENQNGIVFFQGSTDFGIRYPSIRQYTTHPSRIAPEDSILLSVRAPVGTLNQALCECCIGRGLAAINEKSGSNSYLWSQMTYFKQVFDYRNSVGTTFGSITKDDLFSLKVVLPSKDAINHFKSIVDSFHQKIKVNSIENQKLSELRDWLLPLLMNGQVTFGKVKEELGQVAKEGVAYKKDKESIDTLFENINFDYEVAVVQLLTERRFGFTYGKKYTHKMFSNIELLNTMPKLKELVFEEKGWGMFSKAIAKTIDAQCFVYQYQLDNGTKVLKVKSSAFKEVLDWTNQKENKEFVEQVNAMLDLYEKPLINKDMDRIELFNTVLKCIKVLETDSLQSIRNKMAQWPMEEGGYRSKAEKFNENETLYMIGFIKNEILNEFSK
ncbi:restriction endonuclease subunit S [Flagellimonas lutimaris]|uniref:restriction endonuclease subunit S n=1 Tax=Flagellimonas lutimaris TaxID=475082 RepID=UPI003F5CF64C